jgi:hypothetical protein
MRYNRKCKGCAGDSLYEAQEEIDDLEKCRDDEVLKFIDEEDQDASLDFEKIKNKWHKVFGNGC